MTEVQDDSGGVVFTHYGSRGPDGDLVLIA